MKDEEICYLPAYEMKEKILSQELSSLEITEIIIERIEKINPKINVYCTPTFDLARKMAKKADKAATQMDDIPILNGIPTSIKDLVMTEGIRTTFGSKLYEDFIPGEDEEVVKRLKRAGCVILGKTNTPEFGHVTVTFNLIFGETKNPWNLARTSGGSSGGAGAAVASGLSPLALGSDGGGSIRVPSSLCGVFGFKPTYGRIPKYPRIGLEFYTMDHYGPMTRYVKDAALMLDVMKGPHLGDRQSLPKEPINYVDKINEKPSKLKIGYSLDLGLAKALDSDVEKTVLSSIDKFDSFGWNTEKVKIKMRKAENAFYTLATVGIAYDFKNKLEEWQDRITPGLLKQINVALPMSSMDLQRALSQRLACDEIMYNFFKSYDILITPTTAIPAFELGSVGPPKIEGKAISHSGWYPFTYPFNLTALPAASIPCGWSNENLPIGMQIIGKRFDEKTVLQVSKAFEEIAPWQGKKPKLN
jgi:aspartyl-tRNA(Asn)/glutamyl-tRNA(Gln) amidotransferase subunit A